MGASTFSGSIRSVAGVDFISSKDAATDLGIDRQSSTVLEVNNGTPVADGGAYRDLKVRTLTATGLSSQETIVATTSVTTPLVTNAGTLALSATGANIITLSTNGSERARITSGGNVLVGITTDGNYKLDVASSGPSGTLRVYDQTATTGVTSVTLTPGAGQGAAALLNIDANAVRVYPKGRTDVYTLDVLGTNTASGLHFRAGIVGVANGITVFQTAGSIGAIKLDPGTGGLIGFFGATPVVKQTVTADAASILAALQMYGLAV